jgi:DNA-binding LacI/PurR family transcriptional regulator
MFHFSSFIRTWGHPKSPITISTGIWGKEIEGPLRDITASCESVLKSGNHLLGDVMLAKITDVAHKAGVAISTVSRVLNNSPSVLEETRQKVMKVVAELDYKPNPIARGLAGKQINLIELFFSSFDDSCDFRRNWYLEILNGVNEVVQENQFGLLVNMVAGVLDPKEVFQKVFRHAADGILLVSPCLEEKDILRMLERWIPIVLIGHRIEDPRVDFVAGDNVTAAGQVVDHFASFGHKKIASISGPAGGSGDAVDRLRGFKNAMKKQGLSVPKNYIEEGGGDREWGYEAMRRLLTLSNRPTAVFALDDAMALGAWKAIEQAGLKVGEDIALAGFDDIPEASIPPYLLTTVRQDFLKLSVEAARILVEKIHHPENWTPRRMSIPMNLIVRKSCGSVR